MAQEKMVVGESFGQLGLQKRQVLEPTLWQRHALPADHKLGTADSYGIIMAHYLASHSECINWLFRAF